MGRSRSAVLVRANHHKKGTGGKRDKSLASQRVALDHLQFEREIIGRALEDREQHTCIGSIRLDLRKIMMPLAFSLIDLEMIAAIRIDHFTERGEGLARQRFGGDDPAHPTKLPSFAWRLTSL